MESKDRTLPQEILHDPKYLDQFIAVREDRNEDGTLVGQIVAVGQIPDDVHSMLKKDQKIHPDAMYLFAKPMQSGSDIREHIIVKKEE